MTDTATRDLDTTTGVLDALVAARATADRAEADILALAVHYVDLHPVTDQAPAATSVDRGFAGIRPGRVPAGLKGPHRGHRDHAPVQAGARVRRLPAGRPGAAEQAPRTRRDPG